MPTPLELLEYSTPGVDPNERRFTDVTLQVLKQVEGSEDNETLQPDREFAVSKGVVHVGWYHPFSLITEVGELAGMSDADELANEAKSLPMMFRGDASYLITGGVGGLRKVLAI